MQPLVSGEMRAIPVRNAPIFTGKERNLDFHHIILTSLGKDGSLQVNPGDILAISHTFMAKIYGHYRSLRDLTPDPLAIALAPYCEKSPAMVQLILEESVDILRIGPIFITENRAGIIGANAGIDKSNIADPETYIVIPPNYTEILAHEGEQLEKSVGFRIPLFITDSVGRPFRLGSQGLAVASWGFPAWIDLRGNLDLFGYTIQHSELAPADALASMADFVMGQTDEAIPMVILRGFDWNRPLQDNKKVAMDSRDLQRKPLMDTFRSRDWSNLPNELQIQLEKRFPPRRLHHG
jgi:coenzyme F420-0:L-glutamate ligase/coenzyme F420-1:gamma-L-glutamate ligase